VNETDLQARVRLAAITGDSPPWADGRAGRLVERWLPGGARGVESVRTLAGRHRFGLFALAVVVVAAIVTAVVVAGHQPTVAPPPALPPAISAAPVATSAPPPSTLVVSVVGKVQHPGLVTLSNGARVDDAIRAAGGLLPHTDDTALNLARRLADGEQIYVGIPVPAAVQPEPPAPEPALPGGQKGKNTDPNVKVNLNTATEPELETLPGVGPAMANRILTWRTQHGHFDSISQLRDVGGIGDARYAKLENLVTT
jgi:competence protein ComEA